MFDSKKKIALLLLFFFLIIVVADSANAEETANSSGIGYSVQKISPGDEIKESNSFYDLKVTPGEERKIEAKIINPTNEEITVESKVFSASTTSSGDINYTSENKNIDDSLQFPLSEIATVTSSDVKTTLPPNSEKIVSVTINVPKEAKDGVILGSWYFEKLGQTQENRSGNGITINNKYSYAMAIKLTVNQEISQPKMNLVSVNAELKNYQKIIASKIQNQGAAIVSSFNITAEVMKKGSSTVLFANTKKEMIIAPNSSFEFPVYLGEKQMVPGEYTLKMTAKTSDAKWDEKKWEWTEDFTITKKTAKELNEEAINDPEEKKDWTLMIVLGVILGGLLLTIIGVMSYKIHQNKRKIVKKKKKPVNRKKIKSTSENKKQRKKGKNQKTVTKKK